MGTLKPNIIELHRSAILGPVVKHAPQDERRYRKAMSMPFLDVHGNLVCISFSPIYEAHDFGGTTACSTSDTGDGSASLSIKARNINREQLCRLFAQSPSFTALLAGAHHVFQFVNPAFEHYTESRNEIGRPLADVFPELVETGCLDILNKVYRNAEPYIGRSARIHLRTASSNALLVRFVDFACLPLIEADGTVSGIFLQGNDVTEQKHVEDKLRSANAKWVAALEGAGHCVWDWNLQRHPARSRV